MKIGSMQIGNAKPRLFVVSPCAYVRGFADGHANWTPFGLWSDRPAAYRQGHADGLDCRFHPFEENPLDLDDGLGRLTLDLDDDLDTGVDIDTEDYPEIQAEIDDAVQGRN